MDRAIECVYENNVLRPVGKVQLKEGERIRMIIEKKLPFEPIQLKKNLHKGISELSGMSQGHLPGYLLYHPLIIKTDTTRRARNFYLFYLSFPVTCAVSMSVYEEAFFVGLRMIAEDEFGITGT